MCGFVARAGVVCCSCYSSPPPLPYLLPTTYTSDLLTTTPATTDIRPPPMIPAYPPTKLASHVHLHTPASRPTPYGDTVGLHTCLRAYEPRRPPPARLPLGLAAPQPRSCAPAWTLRRPPAPGHPHLDEKRPDPFRSRALCFAYRRSSNHPRMATTRIQTTIQPNSFMRPRPYVRG